MEMKSMKSVGSPPTKEKETPTHAHECGGCGGNCGGNCHCHSDKVDVNDLQVMAVRNRSEIEANLIDKNTGEILRERIPVQWRSRENKLDYLSVSKIQAYEQCPACFYHQYLSDEGASTDNGNFFTFFGSILHEVVEMASKYYKETGIIVPWESLYDEAWEKNKLSGFDAYLEGKELLKSYFLRNPVDKRTDDPVFIEHEWRGELGGCTFGLMIDYAGIMKNDPTTGILKDYKTNRMPFTPNELESSFQLRVYELVLRRHLLPEVKNWIAGYEMFRFGWQACPQWTEDDLLDAEEYIATTYKQIMVDNTWEEKLNNFCGYRNCRFTCKTYQDFLNNPKRYVGGFNLEGVDYAEIERQRTLMGTYEKIAKKHKEEAADILKVAIQQAAAEGKRFEINGEELELYAGSTQSYRYYDTRNVLLAAGELSLLDDCLSIQKTKMDKVLQARPELRLQLAGCMSTNYASPYIVKKKGGKKK